MQSSRCSSNELSGHPEMEHCTVGMYDMLSASIALSSPLQDGTVRLWQYLCGTELDCFKMSDVQASGCQKVNSPGSCR